METSADVGPEIDEIAEAVEAGDTEQVAREFGDLLFGMANLARHLQIDPEDALRGASDRFSARFEHIERSLRSDQLRIEDTELPELERRWEQAKQALDPSSAEA